jgi:hypothetical protein
LERRAVLAALHYSGLGTKRVDRLTVRDVPTWLNKLPDICLAALRLQRQAQERMRSRLEQAGGIWPADGLLFTTRTGRPIEPRAVGSTVRPAVRQGWRTPYPRA